MERTLEQKKAWLENLIQGRDHLCKENVDDVHTHSIMVLSNKIMVLQTEIEVEEKTQGNAIYTLTFGGKTVTFEVGE
tara:strand:- start:80 stop:310 length:231 start_codon:yes stop_codon:yes gene_type:complete